MAMSVAERYRWYVGVGVNENRDRIKGLEIIQSGGFPGATAVNGLGLWEKELEYCSVFEVIHSGHAADEFLAHLAKELGNMYGQKAVLVTKEEIRQELVWTSKG